MDFAIGWLEKLSASAAYSRTCSFENPFAGKISVTLKTPFVSVPVLSNTIMLTLLSASK